MFLKQMTGDQLLVVAVYWGLFNLLESFGDDALAQNDYILWFLCTGMACIFMVIGASKIYQFAVDNSKK